MLDLKTYPWFTGGASLPNDDVLSESKLQKLLEEINKKNWFGNQKDLVAQYYLQEVVKAGKDNISLTIEDTYEKTIKVCERSNAFNKLKATIIKNDLAKFTMSSLFVIMGGTLLVFFIRAVITQTFLFNFSIDAIVGTIAIVILVIYFRNKLGIVKRYTNPKDYIMLDITALLVCLLLKFALPSFIDVSVFALFGTYYLEKKKLQKAIN